MRKNIVAGNWKSNLELKEAKILINKLASFHKEEYECEMVICPPFPYLGYTRRMNEGAYKIGAQNVSKFGFGAYTGEITSSMLKSFGLEYCIVGHSERREYFKETNRDLKDKLIHLLKDELKPIYCVGEILEDRKENNHFNVVETQLKEALFDLKKEDIKNIVIAYEPIWAIGTGETASPEQADEMHAFIRNKIGEKYGSELALEISILYGGSVKPENAKEIFAQENVDGGLIGGASLKADSFLQIAKSF